MIEDSLREKALERGLDAAGELAETAVAAIRNLVDGEPTEVQFRVRFAQAAIGEWIVRAMTLHEALSEPYECVLEIASEQPDFLPADMLGQDVMLTYERGSLQQKLAGIVSRVEHGRTSDRFRMARIHVVPALRALAEVRNTRIFQDQTVVQILEQVLAEGLQVYGREADLSKLQGTYEVREYTVQYQESDLHFATRLMEEEGIGFFFDHEGDVEKLVLVETNDNFGRVTTGEGNAKIPLVAQQGDLGDTEPVDRFELRSKLGPTSLVGLDFDWTRPASVTKTQGAEDVHGRLREVFDHERPITFSEYDEGNRSYGRNDMEALLQRRFEALQVTQHVAQGGGRVTGFRPGLVFELIDHPDPSLNGKYLLTKVTHIGHPPDASGGVAEDFFRALAGVEKPQDETVYKNTFECIQLEIPYRKPRTTPKPRVHGVQTATVVGPEGEEIYTDTHGRIRVQFHWDRMGAYNDRSSCFMRVVQSLAGPGFGCTFLPRVGMEVMVTFLDGDPDRPVVTGCLYNGANSPPYTLPHDRTKTTIKTRSVPNSDGFNELRFEDAAGSEEIYLHAERNLTEQVKAAHSQSVGSQSVTVSGTRTKTVKKDETNTLQQNRVTTVKQNETLTVEEGNSIETVNAGSKHIEAKTGALQLVGKTEIKIAQNNDHFLYLKGVADLKSTEKVHVEAGPGAACVWANRNGELTLHANAKIRLQCGTAHLELTEDGKVVINGTEVELKTGNNKVVTKGDGTLVTGAKVSVEATGEAVVKGSTVNIN